METGEYLISWTDNQGENKVREVYAQEKAIQVANEYTQKYSFVEVEV